MQILTVFETISLGEFIKGLKARPSNQEVRFGFGSLCPTRLASYRGYYDHLALGYSDGPFPSVTVDDLLKQCLDAVGATFMDGRGGHYVMDRDTPLWVSNEGECGGTTITGFGDDDSVHCIILTGYNGG